MHSQLYLECSFLYSPSCCTYTKHNHSFVLDNLLPRTNYHYCQLGPSHNYCPRDCHYSNRDCLSWYPSLLYPSSILACCCSAHSKHHHCLIFDNLLSSTNYHHCQLSSSHNYCPWYCHYSSCDCISWHSSVLHTNPLLACCRSTYTKHNHPFVLDNLLPCANYHHCQLGPSYSYCSWYCHNPSSDCFSRYPSVLYTSSIFTGLLCASCLSRYPRIFHTRAICTSFFGTSCFSRNSSLSNYSRGFFSSCQHPSCQHPSCQCSSC